jgi:phage tail-like protein
MGQIIFKLHLQGPDLSREIILKPGSTSLGREPGNDIQLPYPKISRRHASFDCTDTSCTIQDLGSANGTLVDGVRLQPDAPVTLQEGSLIEIDVVQIRIGFEVIIVTEPPVEKIDQPTFAEVVDGEVTSPELPEENVAENPLEDISEKRSVQEIDGNEKNVLPVRDAPPPPSEPPQQPLPPSAPIQDEPEGDWTFPPGLSDQSIRLLNYLPGIYHTPFMSNFMAMFESIWMPVEWTIDNFDLFLSPNTAPEKFLPWLSAWHAIVFDASWSEEKRRLLLSEANDIYARRGTRWALSRLLEIYTGETPRILEFEKDMEPHTFKVILKGYPSLDKALVTRLIDANKPTHTSYQLEIMK